MGIFAKLFGIHKNNKLKDMPEIEAVNLFLLLTFTVVKRDWPKIVNEFDDIFRPNPYYENEPELNTADACYEFCLAVIAIEIQALPNFLTGDQADRIKEYILRILSDANKSEYPRNTIKEYENAWDQALKNSEYPFSSFASILFDKLGCQTGTKIGNVTVQDPLITMFLSEKILPSVSFWKKITQENNLIP